MRNAVVLDVTLPRREYGDPAKRAQTPPRMRKSGYSFVSLTLHSDSQTRDQVIEGIAKQRHYFLTRPEEFVLVESADDIVRAKESGRLGVGFHFQAPTHCSETSPWSRSITGSACDSCSWRTTGATA